MISMSVPSIWELTTVLGLMFSCPCHSALNPSQLSAAFAFPTAKFPLFRGRTQKTTPTRLLPHSLCFSFSVPAEQELQPLCCHLLPAGGEAQVAPEQLSRGAARGRAAAPAQHRRRADRGQGEAPRCPPGLAQPRPPPKSLRSTRSPSLPGVVSS